MSLLIRYAHIPFYFCFSFTFSTSSIHHYAPLLWGDCMQLRSDSLHWADLTYLMDTWFMIHMYLLLFLVSPTCLLLWSDQSWAFALHSQVLRLGWALCSLSCFSFVFNLPVFTFRYREAPKTNHPFEFPPEFRVSTYALSHTTLTSHHFASHCTATIPLSLLVTSHLETIPCPQITPPQSHIGFTLRSPAP